MCALLVPSYTEDQLYAAYQDRLLIKSLGVQAGVVGAEDYKITAGTGKQVNIEKGSAFVEETKAIEEESNSFYNGFYYIGNPTKKEPHNEVEVSAVNPQIAQIILRVYDEPELKGAGESHAYLEWLNGEPTTEATKENMEAHVYKGAKELPQSSYRLAYILVPKNATKSEEYYIEDTRIWSTTGPWNKPIFVHENIVESTEPALGIRMENGGRNARLKGFIELKAAMGLGTNMVTFAGSYLPPKYALDIGVLSIKESAYTFFSIHVTATLVTRIQPNTEIPSGSKVVLNNIGWPLT